MEKINELEVLESALESLMSAAIQTGVDLDALVGVARLGVLKSSAGFGEFTSTTYKVEVIRVIDEAAARASVSLR